MELIKINENSWHYKIVRWTRTYDMPDNICDYRKTLIASIVAFIGIGVVESLTVGACAFLLSNLVFGLMTLISLGPDYFFPEAIIPGAAVLVFGGVLFYPLYREEYVRGSKPKDDGVIRKAYLSWKEKYCAPVTYE